MGIFLGNLLANVMFGGGRQGLIQDGPIPGLINLDAILSHVSKSVDYIDFGHKSREQTGNKLCHKSFLITNHIFLETNSSAPVNITLLSIIFQKVQLTMKPKTQRYRKPKK